MFDIDFSKGYRPFVPRIRAIGSIVFLTAGAMVVPFSARGAVWQRAEWTDAPVGDAVAPGDRRLWNGRILLRGPGISADQESEIATRLESRAKELFESEGWAVPFTGHQPLRILLISSADADFSRYSGPGTLGDPAIAVNVRGRTAQEAVREIVRDAALIVLRAQSPAADAFLAAAAARALSLDGELFESDREEVQVSGGAPEGTLRGPGREIFAAAWILEMSRHASKGFLHRAWTSRIGVGDGSFDALSAFYAEMTGRSPAQALRVALERLYAGCDVFAGGAMLSDTDLTSGAMNVSAPGPYSWRFYSMSGSLPEGRTFAWPEDAAEGFAVLRYEDGMPSDLVAFQPGESKTLPLSGISRIDWVIPGGEHPASPLAAPVAVVRVPDFPAAGLSAQAHASPAEGVTLDWQTSSHRDLSGWAVFRSEVDETGRVVRKNPEWLPAQTEDRGAAGYLYVDRTASPGHFYRYDVWAVTVEGALSHAFRATVQAR
jgi:hypothetical protein